MLLRIACVRCRLGSLWTDEPHSFLATVCRDLRRCEATLLDEQFCGVTHDSTNQGRYRDPEPEVVTNFASTAPHSPPRS